MKVWREIFLEMALRAIRRTHYEFGIWELGQKELTLQNFKDLNQGLGIFFAPEETVRDAIAQEIMLSGIWKQHPIEGEPRSYWIDRDVRLNFDLNEARNSDYYKLIYNDDQIRHVDIDIVFKRIEITAQDGETTIPTLIEAKRFELVKIDLQTKKIKETSPQFKRINQDILKLKLLKDVYKNKKLIIKDEIFPAFRTYLFIWGLGQKGFDIENDFINKLKSQEYLSKAERSIRYLPIQWNDKLEVLKYLWVGLFQID